jgi:hypothetical protein
MSVKRMTFAAWSDSLGESRTEVELGKLIKGMSPAMRTAIKNLINDTCNGPVDTRTLAGLERRGLVNRYGNTTGDAYRVVDMIESLEWVADLPHRVKLAQEAAAVHYADACSDDVNRSDGQGVIYLDGKADLLYRIRQAYGMSVDAQRIYEIMVEGDFIVADAFIAWIDEEAAKVRYEEELAACILADEADRLAREAVQRAAELGAYRAGVAAAESLIDREADSGPEPSFPRELPFGTGYGVPYHL